jgi:tRNA-2-methylthio-N6-dimethylallyladenosine synthase
MSSNPWDFSDELIDVIASNPNIAREIHLPVQSGDNDMLKRMNRWYTREEYLNLIQKMKLKIPGVQFTTDIIVGFCGESDKQFEQTYNLAEQAEFTKAFIAMYSERPMTAATKVMNDDIPHPVKKERWERLDKLINKS